MRALKIMFGGLILSTWIAALTIATFAIAEHHYEPLPGFMGNTQEIPTPTFRPTK